MFTFIQHWYGIDDIGSLTNSYIQTLFKFALRHNNPDLMEEEIEKKIKKDILKHPEKYSKEEIKNLFMKKKNG